MASLPRRTTLAIVAIAATGIPFLTAAPASAASLGTPGGLAPNSGSTEYKNPVLSWNDVAGASSYRVEMSRSDDFSDSTDLVPLAKSGVTTVASFALPQTLVHGNYWWRVQAVSPSGSSSWSAVAQLDRGWDDSPSTAGSNPTGDATTTPAGIATYPWRFAWAPVPDASSYEIEFSADNTFPQPGTTQSGKDSEATVVCLTTATSFTPYSTGTNTKDVNVDGCAIDFATFGSGPVYWRVRAIDDSTASEVKASNQLDDVQCFGVPVEEDSNLGAGTTTALGTPASGGQECSLWSAERTVAVPTIGSGSATTPGTVSGLTLNCPAGSGASAYACATTPEISWNAVANVDEYAVTIADDASFTNVERTYTTPFLSLTPRDQLANYTAGKGYYVAIQSCTNGFCGASTETTFTKRTPAVTGLSVNKVQGGVRLTWNDLLSRFGASAAGDPAVEAESYKVQVTRSADPGFAAPISSLTAVVDASCDNTTATCYTPPSQNAAGSDQVVIVPRSDGSYIWRVMPIDLTGNVLPATVDGHAFTVDVTRPSLSITTRSGVSIRGPISIRASEPVTGVSASSVHVVRKGTTAAVAGSLRQGASPTVWVFTPKHPLDTGGTYVLTVSATVRDLSGNSAVVAGHGVRTNRVAPNTSKGWSYSSGWHKHSASGARSGSFRSAAAGGTATIKVVGTTVNLYGCKAPNMGSIKVTIGGHSTTVSEHQSFTRCGVLILHKALPKGEQRVKVTVAHGTGNIDELTVS